MSRSIITEQEKALARQSLEMALGMGASKARVTIDKNVMDLAATLDGEVDKVTHCMDCSLSIALFAGGKYGSFSTNALDESSLRTFIGRAVQTVLMLEKDACRDLPDPVRCEKGALGGNELQIFDPSYFDVTPEERKDIALGLSVFGKMPSDGVELISEEGEYSDSASASYVVDTAGVECLHTETSFEYGVEITVRDASGDKFSDYWWTANPFRADFDASSCGRIAFERAAAQSGAEPVRGGRHNMVVDPEVASKLVSPLLNALNAYSIQQNNSFLADTLGKRMFSPGFTIKDECRAPGKSGSRLFDSEGVATVEDSIIEDGVVRKYFINTYMSGKTGMPPTVEEAIRPKVQPWPRKGTDRASILREVGSGILVTDFNGGNSNPVTGDFSYGVSGFYFRNGRIVKPVREMLVTGNFISLWNDFIMAGDDSRDCMSKLIPTLAFKNVTFN